MHFFTGILRVTIRSILGMLIVLSGCAGVQIDELLNPMFEPRDSKYTIDVYNQSYHTKGRAPSHQEIKKLFGPRTSDKEIPSHTVIARIHATGAQAASWAKLVKNAKKTARQLGGDALIIGAFGTAPAFDSESIHGKAIHADVIRYLNPRK